MGSNTYNVVKAPIGWSLFCNRERIGGYGSSEEALEAAMAFGTHARTRPARTGRRQRRRPSRGGSAT